MRKTKKFDSVIYMDNTIFTDEFPTKYDDLKLMCVRQQSEIKVLQTYSEELSKRYKFMLRKLQAQIYAASSEKIQVLELPFFNEAELLEEVASSIQETKDLLAKEISDEPSEAEVISTQKKKSKGRSSLPKELPREVVVHDLKEEDKICKKDGSQLHKIGEEIAEELHYTPPKLKVIRHVTNKYGCRACEDTITIADKPEKLIPKSNATSSLLSHICISKYMDHLPLYRQEQMFKRFNIDISRTTLASWMIKLGEALQPIVNLMMDELRGGDVLHCDETTIRVLKHDGVQTDKQAYFWALGRWLSDQKIIVFNYDRTRSSQVPKNLLSEFNGYLCVDGYGGYDSLCKSPQITRVGCLAHIRRKFVEFLKTLPKKERSDHKASIIVSKIALLFKIEAEIKDLAYEKKYEIRQSKSMPIFEELENLVAQESISVSTVSPYGKALAYAMKELPFNKNYLKCGKVEISNNFIENGIRPLALGRKNWLFADSEKGADASANIYSVLITAKYNNKDLYSYMSHIINELPKCKTIEDYESLLPYSKNSDQVNVG